MRKLFLIGLLGIGLACGSPLRAVTEIVSGIFGFNNVTLLGNSDTIVSIPFARMSAADLTVASYSGSQVTIQDSVSWTAGQFVYSSGVQSNTYYLRFNSGALEGRYYDITNNGANTLTLDLKGGSLSGLTVGDQVSIVPHWTFGTVFVNGNGIHLSSSAFSHNTDVIVPNVAGDGINLNAAAATYYYYTNSGSVNWRLQGSTSNRNDDVIQPNKYLIIRHNISSNTTFTSYGDVMLTKAVIPLRGNTTDQQDNLLSLPRPIDLTLDGTSLIQSGAFKQSPSAFSPADQLFVYNNSLSGLNKSAAGTYFYVTNSGWRKQGDTINNYGTSNVLSPGAGFVIRKASGSASTFVFTNSPTYTNN